MLACMWTFENQIHSVFVWSLIILNKNSLSDLYLCSNERAVKKENIAHQLADKFLKWLGWNLVCP